jgi:predicted branched-subunit amino acid permease
LPPETKTWHRLTVGFMVTDEIFGMAIAEEGKLNPYYYFGMMAAALPGWSLGTFLGTAVGNILPASVVSALSVGLYGMFLAVIVPAAKRSKVILGVVVVSMAASLAGEVLPLFAAIPSGTRLILLTVVISSLAAILFPVKEEAADG